MLHQSTRCFAAARPQLCCMWDVLLMYCCVACVITLFHHPSQVLARHVLTLPHKVPSSSVSVFDVVELLGDKVLLKLPFLPMEAYHVLTMKLYGRGGAQEQLSQLSSFVHLAPQDMFLTVCHHTLTTWNFKVRKLSDLCDRQRQQPGEVGCVADMSCVSHIKIAACRVSSLSGSHTHMDVFCCCAVCSCRWWPSSRTTSCGTQAPRIPTACGSQMTGWSLCVG